MGLESNKAGNVSLQWLGQMGLNNGQDSSLKAVRKEGQMADMVNCSVYAPCR